MTTATRITYTVMAFWLLIASGGRIAIQLTNHQPLDALPIISITLALTALAIGSLRNHDKVEQ